MSGKLGHQQYASVNVSTVDRGRLLLMMYDGGLNFLKKAKHHLEEKDIPNFAKFLSKAQAIIAELINTLDFEKGGEIARNLDSLYDFMMYHLTEANLHKDPEKIAEVIKLLGVIASAYREVIERGDYQNFNDAEKQVQIPQIKSTKQPDDKGSKNKQQEASEQPSQLRVAL